MTTPGSYLVPFWYFQFQKKSARSLLRHFIPNAVIIRDLPTMNEAFTTMNEAIMAWSIDAISMLDEIAKMAVTVLS